MGRRAAFAARLVRSFRHTLAMTVLAVTVLRLLHEYVAALLGRPSCVNSQGMSGISTIDFLSFPDPQGWDDAGAVGTAVLLHTASGGLTGWPTCACACGRSARGNASTVMSALQVRMEGGALH